MSTLSQLHVLLVAAAVAASTIACGGSASMTGPDAPAAAAPASRGATIQGTVQSGVAASEVSAASVGGIRVSVVGTSLQVTTDGSGRFTLSGVPAGRVELRFEGSGIDARLTIEGLVAGQTLELTVRVSGNSASRVDDGDDDDDEVEFEGTIDSVSPGDNSLVVASRKVIVTPGSTRILGRNDQPITLASLAPGDRVEVEGAAQSDGSIRAEKIKLEDEDDDDDGDDDEEEVEFEGSVSALNPLTIAGRRVTTNTSTRYLGHRGDPVPASDVLKVGNKVEVEGRLQTDGSVLAEKIKLED